MSITKPSLFPTKQTKIIAIIGPATSSVEMLEQLLLAGMNVVRINASHGDHAAHKETIHNIRKLDEELGSHTSILVDLQGPKLRIGELEGDEMELVTGSELRIKVGEKVGTNGVVYTNYRSFAKDVKEGESVLLDDGKLQLCLLYTSPSPRD